MGQPYYKMLILTNLLLELLRDLLKLGSNCSKTPPRQSTSSLLSTPRVERSSVCEEENELVDASFNATTKRLRNLEKIEVI